VNGDLEYYLFTNNNPKKSSKKNPKYNMLYLGFLNHDSISMQKNVNPGSGSMLELIFL